MHVQLKDQDFTFRRGTILFQFLIVCFAAAGNNIWKSHSDWQREILHYEKERNIYSFSNQSSV